MATKKKKKARPFPSITEMTGAGIVRLLRKKPDIELRVRATEPPSQLVEVCLR